ncbi:AzlD domain-containing protein [Thalassotalea fusca]
MDNFWIILLGMSLITFSCRYLFLSKTIAFDLNERTKRLLSFTAPSVLTAMWVPIVFMGHKESSHSFLGSPFLWAGMLALLLSMRSKNTLFIVITSIACFAVIKVSTSM